MMVLIIFLFSVVAVFGQPAILRQGLTTNNFRGGISGGTNVHIPGKSLTRDLAVTNFAEFGGLVIFAGVTENRPLWLGPDNVLTNGSEVIIPAGAGAITNVVWANNTTYILQAGTNNVVPQRNEANSVAAVYLIALTNVTLKGLGWNSVIFSTNIGTYFHVSHCHNVTFEDFAIIGTRHNYSLIGAGGLFVCFNMYGTNSDIKWKNVWLKDHVDHGISPIGSPGGVPTNLSTNCLVENCLFEDIGSTNNPSAPGDGAAVQVPGDYFTVRNCRFLRCSFGLEFQASSQATRPIRNVLVERNVFEGTHKNHIVNFEANGSGTDTFTDVIIRDNVFKFNSGASAFLGGFATGIAIQGMQRGLLLNNIFEGGEAGIGFGVTNVAGWQIVGNIWKNISKIAIEAHVTSMTFADFLVAQNYATNIGGEFLRMSGGRRWKVKDNTLNDVANTSAEAAMILKTGVGSSLTMSNIIEGNRIVKHHVVLPGMILEAGVTNTIVKDNIWDFIPVGAWTDAGTDNHFYENWLGTNRCVRSKVILGDFTTNITGAVTIGTPQSTAITLTSDGAHTLANPNVTDGMYHGQEVVIRMEGANTVVFTDGQNVELNAATITLSDRDFLILRYDAPDSVWYLVQHMNNL